MIGKLTIYDLFGNLLPGVTFLWLLKELFNVVGWKLEVPVEGQLAETSVLVAVGYTVGVIIQAIAEAIVEKGFLLPLWGGFHSTRWMSSEDLRLSEDYKARLNRLVTERFHVTKITNREKFFLCYNFVDSMTDRPKIFNAQYGFFRALLTMLFTLTVLTIILAVTHWDSSERNVLLRWIAIFVPSLVLCYFRCEKRSEDFAQSVLDAFIASARPRVEKDEEASKE
jgi:hypothetical protein